MKEIIGKYRTDSLTPEELEQARKASATISDDELAEAIHDDWRDFEPDQSHDTDALQNEIFGRIAASSIQRRSRWNYVWHIVRTAAVIALPILLFSTIYYYNLSHEELLAATAVSTGSRDKASITLPDGSSVSLNGASSIDYDMASFNRGERTVRFCGEGYFDVTKLTDGAPFVIDAYGLTVTVTGTEFNLKARENAGNASLFLIEGTVNLKSKYSGNEVELHANEKATLDYATGHINVSAIDVNDNPTAWRDNRMKFNNAPLSQVVACIADHFDCQLSVDNSVNAERFTGMIPLVDLSTAISVVERAFQTQITIIK